MRRTTACRRLISRRSWGRTARSMWSKSARSRTRAAPPKPCSRLTCPTEASSRSTACGWGDPDDIDQNGNVISTPLQRTSFDLAWRDDKSTGPAVSSYAVDGPRNTVYVFFNAAEETCVVTLDYTVEDALGVYRDAGELYWSYVNSNWEVDSPERDVDGAPARSCRHGDRAERDRVRLGPRAGGRRRGHQRGRFGDVHVSDCARGPVRPPRASCSRPSG